MNNYFEGNKQGYCPKCGKEIIQWNDSVIDGDQVFYYFSCECGLAGCESYKLTYETTSGENDFVADGNISISA